VNLSKKVNLFMVRDAITNCFVEAHSEVFRADEGLRGFQMFEDIKILHVRYLIETMFEEIGGDFNNPTRGQLGKILVKLKEYAAASFRKPEVAEKHAGEIKMLIEKIEGVEREYL